MHSEAEEEPVVSVEMVGVVVRSFKKLSDFSDFRFQLFDSPPLRAATPSPLPIAPAHTAPFSYRDFFEIFLDFETRKANLLALVVYFHYYLNLPHFSKHAVRRERNCSEYDSKEGEDGRLSKSKGNSLYDGPSIFPR